MAQPAILVVDDEAPMRKFVSHNLKAGSYAVHTAADGTEAPRLLVEHPPDLLPLDIGLAGLDGLAVLDAVRRYRGPGAAGGLGQPVPGGDGLRVDLHLSSEIAGHVRRLAQYGSRVAPDRPFSTCYRVVIGKES